MKLHKKSWMALCLIVLMVAALVTPASAATKDTVKRYQTVCCIGDSAPSGYGINGNGSGDLSWNTMTKGNGGGYRNAHFGRYLGTYPDLVTAAVSDYSTPGGDSRFTGDYRSMTCVGMGMVESFYILGGEVEDEEFWEKSRAHHIDLMNQAGRWNSMNYMYTSGAGIENVSAASLVLIAVGTNDVFTFPKNESQVDGELDFMLFMENATKGYNQYVKYYPQLIERVQELNPYADIVLVGQYNPYQNLEFSGIRGRALSASLTTNVNSMNTMLKRWASEYGCTYVDVRSVADYFESKTVEEGEAFQAMEDMDNHPNAEGHQYIADRIIYNLEENEESVSTPVNGLNHLVVNGVDVGQVSMRAKGDGWTIRTMDGKYLCYDSANNAIALKSNVPSLLTGRTVWTWSSVSSGGWGGWGGSSKTCFSCTENGKTVYLTANDDGFALSSSSVTTTISVLN